MDLSPRSGNVWTFWPPIFHRRAQSGRVAERHYRNMSLAPVSTSSCPACGAAFRHLYSKTVATFWRCETCGLGRTETSGFDPTHYYTEDYFSGAHADGYQDYVGEESVLRREFARTVAFVRRFRPGGRLIELGCAYGFFLQEAKPYFDVYGIELAADAAARAAQRPRMSATASPMKPICRRSTGRRHCHARRHRASA